MNVLEIIKTIILKLTKRQNDIAGVILLFTIPLFFCIVVSWSVFTGKTSNCGTSYDILDVVKITLVTFGTSFAGFLGGLTIAENE